MTVTEYLAWCSGDNQRYELVDGQPRAIVRKTTVQGFLQSELGGLIGNHLRARGSLCSVIANPSIVPQLMTDYNLRIPDIGVTCSPLVPAQMTLADPVLLVEILSPASQYETWSNVWAYSTIPSVRELLVLHTNEVAAEVLRRTADGSWPQRFEPATRGTLSLESLGFQVLLSEIYAGTGLLA